MASCWLDDFDFAFGQAGEVIDSSVILPVRGGDLPVEGRLLFREWMADAVRSWQSRMEIWAMFSDQGRQPVAREGPEPVTAGVATAAEQSAKTRIAGVNHVGPSVSWEIQARGNASSSHTLASSHTATATARETMGVSISIRAELRGTVQAP